MVSIDEKAPEFTEDVFHGSEIRKVSLADYKGKWVILFFYPGDFTFVCPTELGELASHYQRFKDLNTEVISVSVDSVYVHKAWHDQSPTIKKVLFPMLADPARRVCSAYGTLISGEGVSLRATFLIDPDGVIKAYEFHNNSIGRSIPELLRKLNAAQYVREHGGEACPVNWSSGQKTLKPGLDIVGKI